MCILNTEMQITHLFFFLWYLNNLNKAEFLTCKPTTAVWSFNLSHNALSDDLPMGEHVTAETSLLLLIYKLKARSPLVFLKWEAMWMSFVMWFWVKAS